ncbi:nuclease EXOG, mitochondrial isoform X2 [Chlorocebus sabaeus]|uniref:nuclease EXOG, mitochondrial isoform X2 n=1 Tax=Chlorocebus sabaeus TaxID=60711 RepID=UPI003BF9CE9C
MATKSIASRLRGSRRFLSGFVAGAVVGAAGAVTGKQPDGSAEKAVLEQFGFPLTGTETRCYTNHALSYDQAKRVPRWVLEHISKSKTMGDADRKHCKFKPDPSIPPAFSAFNEDYVGSGWSRGHMAPAGNNKFSSKAMAETFYLSNSVPQDFDNNSGYWNRIEMYCRELTERFEDVWVISGPLTLPQTRSDGKKVVSYQVIGEDNVAVPSHLYKTVPGLRESSCGGSAVRTGSSAGNLHPKFLSALSYIFIVKFQTLWSLN